MNKCSKCHRKTKNFTCLTCRHNAKPKEWNIPDGPILSMYLYFFDKLQLITREEHTAGIKSYKKTKQYTFTIEGMRDFFVYNNLPIPECFK